MTINSCFNLLLFLSRSLFKHSENSLQSVAFYEFDHKECLESFEKIIHLLPCKNQHNIQLSYDDRFTIEKICCLQAATIFGFIHDEKIICKTQNCVEILQQSIIDSIEAFFQSPNFNKLQSRDHAIHQNSIFTQFIAKYFVCVDCKESILDFAISVLDTEQQLQLLSYLQSIFFIQMKQFDFNHGPHAFVLRE